MKAAALCYLCALCGSSVSGLDSSSPLATPRLYISGDTLIHDNLKEIPRRYPAIDLALIHLAVRGCSACC